MFEFLTREEMLAVIDAPGVDWVSQRDKLLLALLYNTGARVSEVIGVKVGDVVLAPAACVHLHGKGRKQRSVPLWRSTVKAIRAWLRFNPDLTSVGAAAQPRRTGDDAIQRDAAPGIGRQDSRAHDAEPGRENDLSALPEAFDGHAPSAVGRGHHRDRPVARTRESGDNAPVR